MLRREDLDGAVTLLTLDRPEARNALSADLRTAIGETFERLGTDDAVRAVVITGAGGHFCAGGDVKSMGDHDPAAIDRRMSEMVRVAGIVGTFEKPLVAAVAGHAAGAGLSLACLADVIVAEPSARFTVAFLNIGLGPDWALSHTLPRRVGHAAARRMTLDRRRVDAEEGERLGLVDVLAREGEGVSSAVETARGLASAPAGGVAAVKRFIGGFDALRAALEAEAVLQRERLLSREHAEGVAAFREKRAPDWSRAGG